MTKDYQQLNGAALAFYGDAVYEMAIRGHLIEEGQTNPQRLHQLAVPFVEAKGQAKIMKYWLAQDDFLDETEIAVYKRGRNYKANTKAKNASIQDYRQATGFEALIGWLALSQQNERLNTLITMAIQFIEKGDEQSD